MTCKPRSANPHDQGMLGPSCPSANAPHPAEVSNHHLEAAAEADTHRVEAEEVGSEQVAVDRSLTPSSV